MLHRFAVAAALALALPTVALAQEHHDEHHGPPPHGAPPHPGGPPGAKPFVPPHGPPPHGPPPHGPPPHGPMGPMAGPHPGGPPPGAQFSYRGHMVNRVHINPFIYPPGWAYRRWAVGAVLPPIFLARDYWYADWAALGLAPPPPGTEWVRYGPDLLLVDVSTGQIDEVVYGVFY